MSEGYLGVYLGDHYAGGVAALELLEHLEGAHAGTVIAQVVSRLHTDIKADHQELDALMRRVGVAPSRVRQGAAWLIEKAGELKVRVDDPADGALRLLETLEALGMGIEGKRALWEALAVVAESVPTLRGPDYAHLIARAREQRRQVEALRLSAAKAAFQ